MTTTLKMTLPILLGEIRKLPLVRAHEIDGEESDGTPRSWRDRPYVSLTQLERLLASQESTQPAAPAALLDEQMAAKVKRWSEDVDAMVDKVYLVATGEVVGGLETYTRHDGAPPPLCDSELLFASLPVASVAELSIDQLDEIRVKNIDRISCDCDEIQAMRDAVAADRALRAALVQVPQPIGYAVERSAFRVSPDGQDAESREWLEFVDDPKEKGAFPVWGSPHVASGGQPAFWVRQHPDGVLTGEVLPDAQMEPVRKNSGGWLPLFLAAAPVQVAPAPEAILIDCEDAHATAWQAAASFRPPYFGENFRAHNWVVEAIRSAHMDGQRLARGLPKINRAAGGELPQELRAQRAAPVQVTPEGDPHMAALRIDPLAFYADWFNSKNWGAGNTQGAYIAGWFKSINELRLRGLLAAPQVVRVPSPVRPNPSKAKALKNQIAEALRVADNVGRSRGNNPRAKNLVAVDKIVDLQIGIDAEIDAAFAPLQSAADHEPWEFRVEVANLCELVRNGDTAGANAAIRTMERLVTASAGDDWQPMASAPRDGTEVLLWLRSPWSRVEALCWCESLGGWIPADVDPSKAEGMCGSDVPQAWKNKPSAPSWAS